MIIQDLKNALSTRQATITLFCIFAVAMAAATFLEARMGVRAAQVVVYHSWWFGLIFILMCVNFILIAAKGKYFKRKRYGVLILHYGLIVTVAGALITHIWSYEGKMHIRQDETSNMIIGKDNTHIRVPFNLKLNEFKLIRYIGSNTPAAYRSEVTISHAGKQTTDTIAMNDIARVGGYRIYQSSYDEDEKGTILSVNYDPIGTAVTYAGYALLLLGLVWAVVEKGSRLRWLYAELNRNEICGNKLSTNECK